MSCPSPFPGWDEPLDAASRDHLASCGACRSRLVAADPLRAFALLAPPRLEPDEVATMQARVRASLRSSELESKVAAFAERRRHRGRVAAAAAALVVVAGGFWFQGGSPVAEPSPVAALLPAEWPGDEDALLRELANLPVLEARAGTAIRGDERAALVIARLDV